MAELPPGRCCSLFCRVELAGRTLVLLRGLIAQVGKEDPRLRENQLSCQSLLIIIWARMRRHSMRLFARINWQPVGMLVDRPSEKEADLININVRGRPYAHID